MVVPADVAVDPVVDFSEVGKREVSLSVVDETVVDCSVECFSVVYIACDVIVGDWAFDSVPFCVVGSIYFVVSSGVEEVTVCVPSRITVVGRVVNSTDFEVANTDCVFWSVVVSVYEVEVCREDVCCSDVSSTVVNVPVVETSGVVLTCCPGVISDTLVISFAIGDVEITMLDVVNPVVYSDPVVSSAEETVGVILSGVPGGLVISNEGDVVSSTVDAVGVIVSDILG